MIRFSVRKFINDEKGAIAPMAAMLFLTMLGFVALGTDVSQWMMQKRDLQTAADAAALAGAYELVNGLSNNDAEAAALKEAEKNGYNPAAAGAALTTTIDPNGNGTGIATVKVDLQERGQGWFTKVLSGPTVNTAVEAIAAEEVAGSGQYCMLATGTSGSNFTISGNVTVDATTCGLAGNSNSSSSLAMNGNTTVDVGAVNLAGGYTGGKNFSYTSLKENTDKQTADPYADFTPPSPPHTCSASDQSSNKTYSGLNSDGVQSYVYCGGFTPAGNLNPGVYYVDGGDFGANGGNITGTGVTIIITNSGGSNYGSYGHMVFHGNASFSISAPTTGATAGIAIYQDRNTPTSGCDDTVTGDDTIQIDGVIYAPSCELEMGGNTGAAGGAGLCTEVIANNIWFHGTPAIGTDCVGKNVKGIGVTYKVQLIE